MVRQLHLPRAGGVVWNSKGELDLNKKLFLTPLTAVAALALGLAAVSCGGDDDDDNGNGNGNGNGATQTPSGNGDAQTTFDMLMNESDGNVFVLDGENNPTLTVPAGEEITINLTNEGSAIHNMRFAGEDNQYNTGDDAASDPALVNPGDTATLVFTAPDDAGTYLYQCDLHPTDMLGEIVVVD